MVLSVLAGVLMGFFYRFVAASMSSDFNLLEAGKLSPYTAMVVFSVGLLLSNFVWNTLVMRRPFVGEPVSYATTSRSEIVPGFGVTPVDTTGAGDVFNGALAVALAEDKPLRDAVRFANAAVALSVTKIGAQPSAPDRQEIEALLSTT